MGNYFPANVASCAWQGASSESVWPKELDPVGQSCCGVGLQLAPAQRGGSGCVAAAVQGGVALLRACGMNECQSWLREEAPEQGPVCVVQVCLVPEAN